MQVYFKPKTKLGKWSAWLIVAFTVATTILAVLLYLAFGGDISGSEAEGRFFLWLHLLVGIAPIHFNTPFGVAAFITGVISIVRSKERSVAVCLAVTLGSLFTIIQFITLCQVLSYAS